MRWMVLGLALLALAGCGGGHAYAANVKTNFLNACETTGTAGACECELSHVEGSVSVNTLQVTEQAIRAGDRSFPNWMTSAAAACTGK